MGRQNHCDRHDVTGLQLWKIPWIMNKWIITWVTWWRSLASVALFTCWTAIHLNKKILHLSGKIMNDLLIDFWWRSKHSVARFTVKVSNAWNRSVVFSDRLVKLNTKPHTKKQEIRTTRRLAIEFRKPFMTVSRFYVRRAGRFFLFSVTIKSLCFFWASLQVCHSCII